MKKAVIFLLMVCAIGAAIFVIRTRIGVSVSEGIATQPVAMDIPITQGSDAQILIDENETPFLAKFRKLYINSDIKFYPVINAHIACIREKDRFAVRCTKKDVDKMKELAEQGDFFSLAVLSFAQEQPWWGMALSEKEPVTIVLEAGQYYNKYMKERHDWKKAEEILKSIEGTFPFISYLEQLRLYKRSSQKDKFCKTAQTAYANFGIFAVGTYFIEEIDVNEILFEACNLFSKGKTREEILDELDTDEARLTLAYKYVEDKKYRLAGDIFERFYNGDDSFLSVSAGYCLGVMHYYGRGYAINMDKGQELIEESHNKGYFYAYQAFPGKDENIPFPVQDTITKHTVNVCGRMAGS
jgi:hypothetical protein